MFTFDWFVKAMAGSVAVMILLANVLAYIGERESKSRTKKKP